MADTQQIQGYRLSLQQESWWQEKHQLLAHCAVIIKGAFSEEEIRSAITRMVARHDILRTRYRSLPGVLVPLQVIDEQCVVNWHTLDLQACPHEQLAPTLHNLLREQGSAGFDYEQGPLLHALIAHLEHGQLFLCLTMPSLHTDIRSLLLLLEELHAYLTASEPAWLDEPPIQYVQFSEWQHEQFSESAAEQGQAFWQRQGDGQGATPVLPLALAREESSFASTSLFTLSGQELSGLETYAADLGMTLEDLLFASWHLFLWRLTAQARIAVHRVLDGRTYDELQRSIGLYETAPAILYEYTEQMDLQTIFADLVTMCQADSEWLDYHRPAPAMHPLPCLFAYHTWERWPTLEIFHLQADICRYAWSLCCLQSAGELRLHLHARTHGGGDQQVAYYAHCYQQLLQRFAQQHPVSLAEISLLDERAQEELQAVLTGPVTDASALLPTLFARQVAHTPNLPAIACEGQQLTYMELDQRTNQLAHFLIKRGVGPEVRVALCMHRSVQAIVALLGIWKAGGAYIPLDPDDPAERIVSLLNDVEAALLLTEGELLADLPLHQLPIIRIEEQWEQIEQEPLTGPVHNTAPNDLAYIIYTSGSTGKPNGVCVEHRNLANYYAGIRSYSTLGSGATYATVSTLSADLGNTMIFLALASGGCLHIVTREDILDARKLGAYIEQHHIDCLKIVPSHFAALLNAAEGALPIPRRLLIFGGEMLSWDLVHSVRTLAPGCAVLNHYGPTETTIGVLAYPVAPAEDPGVARSVPIGRPLGNTRLAICDHWMHQVPPGVVGELYVGGDSVTRAYWKRPQLTEERYLLSGLPGARERLYKTGDLVRLLPDGALEFVGRADRQVKIHGHRVDLSEIEDALGKHPRVRDILVTLNSVAGEQRLVAYVLPLGALDMQELAVYGQRHLPAHCLPAMFVSLKQFPLNKNGKRDLHALADPAVAVHQIRPLTTAETATERQVLQCWQQVLGTHEVGIDDRFFEVGGNSMKSIQLLALMQQRYAGTRMTDLFEYNTIRLISAFLDQHTQTQTAGEAIESIDL